MVTMINCPTCGKPLRLGKNAFNIVLIKDHNNGEYSVFLDCKNTRCKDYNKRFYKATLKLASVEDYP